MRPENLAVAASEPRPPRRRWLVLAGLLHCVAMLLVMSALVSLTPITMTFSVGVAGALLGVACGIYVITVALDLRRRRIL